MDTAASLLADCFAGANGQVIAVDVAAAKAIATVHPVTETERLPLPQALGRVLAADTVSPMALPPFDNSAMDGYAIRRADLEGLGPWTLPVRGRVRAGDAAPFGAAGAAVRIFTGAPMPNGFDTVVMQERCRREGDAVIISDRPRLGQNVRQAGEDVRRGDLLAHAGVTLSPQKLTLLAGVGLCEFEAFRKVRVSIISTGNELCEPGDNLGPGQIYNSNRTMLLASLASMAWIEVTDIGIVVDDRRRLLTAISKAVACSDVLITTGGVSAGEEDRVANVLRANGAKFDVLKVAMRPGKPVKIGQIGKTLVCALPGNPNAALITFRQIALPAIRKAAGLRHVYPDWQPARSAFSYGKPIGRTEFVPVRIQTLDSDGVPMLEMLGRGSSASLSAMAQADGIALLPPETNAIEPGSRLRWEPLT